jgi:hypothetical protein
MCFPKTSRHLLFTIILLSLCLTPLSAPPLARGQKAVYVGTEACKGRPEAQVDRFMASSKKARSYGAMRNTMPPAAVALSDF